MTGSDSRTRRPKDDEWTPPSWSSPPQPAAFERYIPDPVRREEAPPDFKPFRSIAIPLAITGALAGLLSVVPQLSANGSIPRGLILLLIIQLVGFALARAGESALLGLSWAAIALTSSVLLPLLSLQVTLLREPYVSLQRNSAGPAMFATFIVIVVLVIGAVWCLTSAWETPEFAALLFMPLAALVPAMIGLRETVYQQPALQALAEVSLLCAATTVLAAFLPGNFRSMVPAITVAVEFVLLWIQGRGPWFHATSGDIVRVLYSLSLATAVLLVVGVPVAAAWVRGRHREQVSSTTEQLQTQLPRAPIAQSRTRARNR